MDKSTLGGQVVSSATNASGNHTEHKWTNEAVARTAGASAGRGVITKGVSASERQGGGGGGGGAAAIAAAGRAAEATGGGTEAGTAAPAYTTPQPSRRRQQHSMAENSPHQNATAGTNAAPRNTGEALRQEGRQPQPRRCSGNDGTARRKRDGRCAAPDARRTEKLLPGQKYQMELVFMPARASAEMAEALQSSFCPGSEVGAVVRFYSIPSVTVLTRPRDGVWYPLAPCAKASVLLWLNTPGDHGYRRWEGHTFVFYLRLSHSHE